MMNITLLWIVANAQHIRFVNFNLVAQLVVFVGCLIMLAACGIAGFLRRREKKTA